MSERSRFPIFALIICGAALALAGCARYADVFPTEPLLPAPPGPGALRIVEQACQLAAGRDAKRPMTALGDYLSALEIASADLDRHPSDSLARRDYNFALSRVVETLQGARVAPWKSPLSVPSQNGEIKLGYRPRARHEFEPALYDFTPSDRYMIRGKYVKSRIVRLGLGAPVVAVQREINPRADQDFAPSRAYYGLTVIAHFQGNRCWLSFEDPLNEETVTISGQTFPLAADFTAPLAVMLEATNPKQFEFSRVLNPEKYAHTAAIERLQPYDPDKKIVLVIHGLMDSQATWTPMINQLLSDPVICRHYQFWFYSYPSGYPYPYSAAILRRELDAVEKRYPARKPMVVIGHSMGGCISRLLITDGGDELWRKVFGQPPDQLQLSPDARAYLSQELLFCHRPEIGRVIFMAAPLRGSNLATSWVGRLARSLIRTPRSIRRVALEILRLPSGREGDLKPTGHANSVDTLSPKSRFVVAINTIPMEPGIPFDTIVGDRGRGDSPNSSDGVVPYWSSHLAGAQHEYIVPSGHSVHQNPQAIEDVRRILRAHAGAD